MGTMLYERGVFLNRSFEEICLSEPRLVLQIHRDYLDAGADVLTTNSWGAGILKLRHAGIADRFEQINHQSVVLARQAIEEAGRTGAVHVAGSIGPLGIRIEPLGTFSAAEAAALFERQAATLAGAGADLIILETFVDVRELEAAVRGVRRACNLPLVASLTINSEGTSLYGTEPEVFTAQIDERPRRHRAQLHRGTEGDARHGGEDDQGGHAPRCASSPTPASGERRRPQHLPDHPGVHGQVRQAADPVRRAHRGRMLRDHARAHQGDQGRDPRRFLPASRMRGSSSSYRIRGFTGAAGEEKPLGGTAGPRGVAHLRGAGPPEGHRRGEDPGKRETLPDKGIDAINVPDSPRAQVKMGAVSASTCSSREQV